MTVPVLVCKHCGGDDIHAHVEARGTVGGYVAVTQDGKPYFQSDGLPDFDDFDEEYFECSDCRKGEFRLEKLVIAREAKGQLGLPCGRCDHDATDHPLLGDGSLPGYTRPPMPCTVDGCDCHDFYDVAVATEPAEGQLEMAA